MFCSKCGTVVPDGARFCRTCGQPLEPPATPQAETPPLTPSLEPLPATPLPAPVSTVVAPPVASYPPPVTPAVVVLPAPYAGFWLRVVAHLIDGAIWGVVFGLILALLFATGGLQYLRGFRPQPYNVPANPFLPMAILGAIFVLFPLLIVAAWLYFALMESSVHQGTLGKMAIGLFVTDLQGNRVSFARASGRFFAKFLTGLIPLFIGYIMAGFTEKKQALHDMIAGCLVLKKI
jgi:uncharacterized RDD family membrane protein YckC